MLPVTQLLWAFLSMVSLGAAGRSLTASSLVTCMDNSQISPSYFNVTFDPGSKSLRYSLDLDTQISGYVIAHAYVYAYGFKIIERDIDLCELGWKQFCPIFPGNLQVDSIENNLSDSLIKLIPGITYNVPDIDAIVKLEIKSRDLGQVLSCLQASFTNGKTVSQVGVKWATAVIAGLGLIISAMMSTFGNSNAALHIAANAVALFLYFQSVVIVCMQSVERVPPIALAWLENLAWSMGLIKVTFMQDIFRWYVQSTGGTPTLFFEGVTEQVLVQRALAVTKRAVSSLDRAISHIRPRSLDFSLTSNSNLMILRGIKRIGINSGIEPTSIVCTGFTFFLIVGYILVALLVIIKSITILLVRNNKISRNHLNFVHMTFPNIIKGLIARYVYFAFSQLVLLSVWEFVQRDSPAVIVLAVLLLLLIFIVLGWAMFNTVKAGRLSVGRYRNPSAILYGDANILQKYGFCFTMFHAKKYWFGVVVAVYVVFKSLFIALCQNAGKVSVIPVFVADLVFTVVLIWQRPYLNKLTNIVNFTIAIVTCLNSFMFMFFSDLFDQPAAVSLIMGWVFFILNAAFSLVLLIMIIVFSVMSLASRNPDAWFAPAKDDRFSFQKHAFTETMPGRDAGHRELSALGIAAQDHNTNWESEMYKLNDLSSSNLSETERKNLLSPYLKQDEKMDGSFPSSSSPEDSRYLVNDNGLGARLKSLRRGFSLKTNKSLKLDVRDDSDTPESHASPNRSTQLNQNPEVLSDFNQYHHRAKSGDTYASMSNEPQNLQRLF